MFAAAFALSLALLGPQDPPATHAQTITCVGVFLMVNVVTAQTAEADPSAENQETSAAAGRLLKAANDDRIVAARREGLSSERSEQAVNDWIAANIENSEALMGRELDPCLQRYMSAI